MYILTVIVGQLLEHALVQIVREHRLALHLEYELDMQILRRNYRCLQHGQQCFQTLQGERITGIGLADGLPNGIRQTTCLDVQLREESVRDLVLGNNLIL